jgi:hypothetical protein
MKKLAKLAACGIAVLFASADVASGAWSAPADVTRSQASRFSVAVNARGDEVFVWQVTRGVSPAPRYREQNVIRARVRFRTGRFGRAHTIRLSAGGILPDVAIAADGTAIAVWTEVVRGHYRIMASVRRPGRQLFARRRQIGRTAKLLGALPKIGIDRKGNAVVVWRHGDTFQWSYRRRGHRFGAPRSIRFLATERRLVVDRRGNAHLVLARPQVQRRVRGRLVTTEQAGVFLATRRPGHGFGRRQRVSPVGAPASQPELAVGADGTAAVVWRRSSTGGSESHPGPIQAAVRAPGERFGQVQTVTAAGVAVANRPRVVVTPGGEAVAAWQQLPAVPPPACPDCMQIATSVGPPGGAFGPSSPIAPSRTPGGTEDLSLVGTERGDVFALWTQLIRPGSAGAVAALRAANGSFGAPEPITNPPVPLLGVFGGGGAVASAADRVVAMVLAGTGLARFQAVTWSP